MKLRWISLALVAGAALARADEKPVVYDHVTKDGAAVDQVVNAALATKYKIVPVEDSPDYVDTKAISGQIPREARSASGEPLKGYVLLAYVVTADGVAADAVVLRSTDERLNPTAIKATESWRFSPATLKGVAIATTAAQEFNFSAPAASTGFDTANIILYQGNAVLEKRLPGAQELADYIKKLQAILGQHFAAANKPANLDVVVMIHPTKIARVWFMPSGNLDGPGTDDLRKQLEAVEPIAVKDGPVAFAISGKLAGGASAQGGDDTKFHPPIPKEWQQAAGSLTPTVPIQDEYLNAVWPLAK